MSEEQNFPENRWDDLRASMESGGAAAVVDSIRELEFPDRLQLFAFAQQAFGQREWPGKNFDDLITVSEAGIAEGLAFAEEAIKGGEEERALRIKDFANVMSYNLAADLAECWPGDAAAHEERHLLTGLKAAENCLRFREELQKDAVPFSIAWWAKGMHEISLGRHADALKSMNQAYDFSVRAARSEDQSVELTPAAGFLLLLSAGYLGIAETLAGREGGKTRLKQALDALGDQAANQPDRAEDARFGLDQLNVVVGRFLS